MDKCTEKRMALLGELTKCPIDYPLLVWEDVEDWPVDVSDTYCDCNDDCGCECKGDTNPGCDCMPDFRPPQQNSWVSFGSGSLPNA